jgi:ubiquinone/menaquinone biosynthesis C-methylase UbiE
VKFHNFVCPNSHRERTIGFKRVFFFSVELPRSIRMIPLDMEIRGDSPPGWQTTAQFDLVAPIYPALERLVFGLRLDEARQAFLEHVLEADRVLLVGEGNGRFLKSLIGRKRVGCVKVVEKSRAMVRLMKNRAGRPRKVALELIEADFLRCRLRKEFDCVVTHFFLDLFNPPAQLAVIDKLGEITTENGTWINVDFTAPRTMAGRVLMWLQYTFFRLVSHIEARRCFDESTVAVQNGWIVAGSRRFLGGFVVAKRYKTERK